MPFLLGATNGFRSRSSKQSEFFCFFLKETTMGVTSEPFIVRLAGLDFRLFVSPFVLLFLPARWDRSNPLGRCIVVNVVNITLQYYYRPYNCFDCLLSRSRRCTHW
jgi:hypothetical protein